MAEEPVFVVMQNNEGREIRTYRCTDWEIQGDFIVLFDTPIEGKNDSVITRRAERIPAAVTRITERTKKTDDR